MTEILPAPLQAHFQQAALTLAACIKVTRRDGVVIAVTEHDAALVIDDGAGPVAYSPRGGFTMSAYRTPADLKSGDIFAEGLADASYLNRADLRAGLYEGADFRLYIVDWSQAAGPNRFYLRARGRLGKATIRDGDWRIEFRTLRAGMQRRILKSFQPGCDVELGSRRCGVPIEPPVWTATTAVALADAVYGVGQYVRPSVFNGFVYKATVAGTTGGAEPAWPTTIGATVVDGSVTWTAEESYEKRATVAASLSRRQMTVTAMPAPRGATLFAFGKVRFASGQNAGLYGDIEAISGAAITLRLDMPFAIANGDAVALFPGCQKTDAVCDAQFSNIVNFQGFPFIPGHDVILAYPDAS